MRYIPLGINSGEQRARGPAQAVDDGSSLVESQNSPSLCMVAWNSANTRGLTT